MGDELFLTSQEGKHQMKVIGLSRFNGWLAPTLKILGVIIMAALSAWITIEQYKTKVDTTAVAVEKLDEKRLKPLEDRVAASELKNAVQDESMKNMAEQVKTGFNEIKQLMREMKQDLKDEIKQKREK